MTGAKPMEHGPRDLVLYLMLAFSISWAAFIPAAMASSEGFRMALIIAGAFGPFLAATITIGVRQGRATLRGWLRAVLRVRLPLTLYVAGALAWPLGIAALQYGLYRALGGASDWANAVPWPLYPLYLIPTALLSGGNEEPGWRGFALPALLERFHPIAASLILGVIHAAWHLPLMGHYDTGFGWYLFNIVPLTFILNALYLRSRRSVLPVMLLHAATNVLGAFVPMPQDVLGGCGTNLVTRGIVYWMLAIALLIATRGTLGHPATDPTSAAERQGTGDNRMIAS